MSLVKRILLYGMAVFYVGPRHLELGRLPFQFVQIAWAWWYTRE